MKWLVKFADNWDDEMNVEGFTVLGTEDFMGFIRLIEAVGKKIDTGIPFNMFIGTNQYITYQSGRQFKDAFGFEVIEDDIAMALRTFLIEGYSKYGLFPSSEEMIDFVGGDCEY